MSFRNYTASAIALLISSLSLASNSGDLHSQVRLPGETFEQAFSRYEARLREKGLLNRAHGRRASDAAVHLEYLNLSKLPVWQGGLTRLYDGFREARDLRFLFAADRPAFARRIPWLYPDDGCYTRAALQGQQLDKAGFVRPAKIFIFGDLEFETTNNPDGKVTWWYHEASIVSDGRTPWILDPAVDPRKPIQLVEWVTTITRFPDSTFLAVCSPYTYSPNDYCYTATANSESGVDKDVAEYLDDEWSRIKDLKRNPNEELGDNPPWKNH